MFLVQYILMQIHDTLGHNGTMMSYNFVKRPLEHEQHARSFDSIYIKYLKFDNVKFIIFSKL